MGGRVVDPETGLDGIRNIGVRGDRIAAVSREPMAGRRVIDVRGLVVAPGFIDLHQHQQDTQTYRLKVLDMTSPTDSMLEPGSIRPAPRM